MQSDRNTWGYVKNKIPAAKVNWDQYRPGKNCVKLGSPIYLFDNVEIILNVTEVLWIWVL